MRILVTSTRMPFALGMVRKLAQAGHDVHGADTFEHAPASHSRYLRGHTVLPSPRYETAAFVDALKRVFAEESIELYVPTFEEAFYVSRHVDELRDHARILVTPFESLASLHDKTMFIDVAERAGLHVPATEVATTRDELREAAAAFEYYLARPSFSRGGVELLANHGPRAGALSFDDACPTAENPWLVQEFVEGQDICSYSVCLDGRLLAHVSYEIPLRMGDAAGMQFRSIDEPRALKAAQAIAAETGFTGNLSFDYRRSEERLVGIECNPRATDGILLMPADTLAAAVVDGQPADGEPTVVAPGTRTQLDFPMVFDLLDNRSHIPRDIKALFTVKDPYNDLHDLLPAFYQVLQFRHDTQLAKEKHIDFMVAMADDVAWDGSPIG